MIYLLEDDESIRKLVTYTLQHAGYEAAGLSCPSAFWAAMERADAGARCCSISCCRKKTAFRF